MTQTDYSFVCSVTQWCQRRSLRHVRVVNNSGVVPMLKLCCRKCSSSRHVTGKTNPYRMRKQTRKDCWHQQCGRLGRILHMQLSFHRPVSGAPVRFWGANLPILLWCFSFASSPFSPLRYVCEFALGFGVGSLA